MIVFHYIFSAIASALCRFRKTAVPITREYTFEFMDRSGAKIFLSTRTPRYAALFSEPDAKLNRAAFEEFRAQCLADFERLTGTKISDAELWNESARPLPSISRYSDERESDRAFPPFNVRTR